MSHSYESPATGYLTEGRGVVQTHRPAFWVYAALFIAGIVLGVVGLGSALENMSVEHGLAFTGTFAFAAFVLWLLIRLSDLDPKPGSILAASFLGGALIATSAAQTTSAALAGMFGGLTSNEAVATALSAATGEEYYKALVVVLIFLIAPWWWRRPLDGIVFGALVGLGFQIYEDIVYVSGAASVHTGAMGSLTIFIDRVLISGLASHPVYTAFFGMGLAYAVTSRTASTGRRIGAVAGGFAFAWAAHFWWDYPMLDSLVRSGYLGTVAVAIVKASPILLVFIPLAVKAVKDERSFFHRYAAPEVDAGVLDDTDVARLETFGSRVNARRSVSGHQERFRLHHLMRAQLDLIRLHVHGFTESAVLEQQRSFIREFER